MVTRVRKLVHVMAFFLLLWVIYQSKSSLNTSTGVFRDWQKVEERFVERETWLRKSCEGRPVDTSISSWLRLFLLYSPAYNLFVFASPKVGSSTWLEHMYVMNGNKTHNRQPADILAVDQLGTSDLRVRLNTSIRVMTTRHPLDRLVSAFRDKYAGGKEIQKPPSEGSKLYFWDPMLKWLRRKKLQVSFTEFLIFTLSIYTDDRHWMPITQISNPCGVRYQYIIKMETFTEDLQFIAKKLNISDIDMGTTINKKSNGTEKNDDYSLNQASLQQYLDISPNILARILKRYKRDFEMFNYQVPAVLITKAKAHPDLYNKHPASQQLLGHVEPLHNRAVFSSRPLQ